MAQDLSSYRPVEGAALDDTLVKSGDSSGRENIEDEPKISLSAVPPRIPTYNIQKNSTSSSSNPPTATASEYTFTTKKGTHLSTFQDYIQTLPDEGKGLQFVFPHNPWQGYITYLTPDQAEEVARQPFVQLIGSSSLSYLATGADYMFTTKPGTDRSTFEEYIQRLDGGKGQRIAFDLLTWQSYITHLTLDQAKEVASEPFINYVTLITESNS